MRIDASVAVLILEIRGQRVMLDADLAGRRSLPYAFSEQGVAMLSSALRSSGAIAVNIAIMRAFVRLRQLAAANGELAKKLNESIGFIR